MCPSGRRPRYARTSVTADEVLLAALGVGEHTRHTYLGGAAATARERGHPSELLGEAEIQTDTRCAEHAAFDWLRVELRDRCAELVVLAAVLNHRAPNLLGHRRFNDALA